MNIVKMHGVESEEKMTKEQAIEILHELDRTIYETQQVALDMAIKSLEQQSSDDCVSRAEVLTAISEDLEIQIVGKPGLEQYNNEVVEILKALITNQENKIQALPPVTPICKSCKLELIDAILNASEYMENGKVYSYTYDNDTRIKHIREVLESED